MTGIVKGFPVLDPARFSHGSPVSPYLGATANLAGILGFLTSTKTYEIHISLSTYSKVYVVDNPTLIAAAYPTTFSGVGDPIPSNASTYGLIQALSDFPLWPFGFDDGIATFSYAGNSAGIRSISYNTDDDLYYTFAGPSGLLIAQDGGGPMGWIVSNDDSVSGGTPVVAGTIQFGGCDLTSPLFADASSGVTGTVTFIPTAWW